jgi:glyoxylase-like metal-dependent hydrolase (beta-lactamase superfamily II)
MHRILIAGIVLLAMRPAPGQVLLSGVWTSLRAFEDEQERGPGPDLGDYLGIPINDAGRLRADSWDASRLTLQEHQCRVHIVPYIYRGPHNLRIWEEKDSETQQIVAIKNYISTYEQTRTIWMDGRPHPSQNAPHTFMGFSTGKWEGDMLTVTTTHMKQGWLRRNGLVESDRATLVEHFIRHGQYMTHVSIVTDPVYLTEPLIRTSDYALAAQDPGNWLWPCEYVLEITNRPKNAVPHHLFGDNPFLHEFPQRWKIPEEATRGGPDTMYPEYRANMKLSSHAANSVPVAPPANDLEVLPVQGNVYMLAGPGGNTTLQVGATGVLIVDTQTAPLTDKMLAAIRKLSNKPIRYVLNTSADLDHTGGNEGIAQAAGSVTKVEVVNTPGQTASQTVQILAHDNVLPRMSTRPTLAWPSETYIDDEKELYFNGEPVLMYHIPKAHTDGDSIVFFRHSDVVSTGDIFDTNRYPVIDIDRGGGLQGVIDGLNRVLEIAIPAHHEEGGTYIIPGHGRICDEFDVLEYRDMLTIIRDRIQAMIKKGATLEQVKAAHPTSDYDPQYGSNAENFIESAYRSLK